MGDDGEFDRFVATSSAGLYRTAYLLLVGDWARAEDLVQVALTKAYLAWHRIQPATTEAYVRRILVTTPISWRRRRWHGERPTERLPDVSGPPDPADQHAERDALWALLRDLPAKQRAVLVLRFYEDLTEQETARILGVSLGTVKSHSSRALATLRRRLDPGSEAHLHHLGLDSGRLGGGAAGGTLGGDEGVRNRA